MGRSVRRLMDQGKNKVKKNLERVEKIARDGVDAFAQDIRNLYLNQQELAGQLDKLDISNEALFRVLVAKGLCTEAEIIGMYRQVYAEKLAMVQKMQEEQQTPRHETQAPPAPPAPTEETSEEGPHFLFSG